MILFYPKLADISIIEEIYAWTEYRKNLNIKRDFYL